MKNFGLGTNLKTLALATLVTASTSTVFAEATPIDTTDIIATLALGTAAIISIGTAKTTMAAAGVVWSWIKGYMIGG